MNINNPTALQPLLKPKEAARMLSISERSLWKFTRSGEIPFVQIGRSVRYDPKDLEALINTRKAISHA
jgi:excisionase family DNA binding protein